MSRVVITIVYDDAQEDGTAHRSVERVQSRRQDLRERNLRTEAHRRALGG